MRNGVLAAIAASSLIMLGASGATGAATSTTTGPTLTTIAGGLGGPDPATNVAMVPCQATSGGSYTYITNGNSSTHGLIWRLNNATDVLTPFAGAGGVYGPKTGVPALSAAVTGCGTAVDGHGNLLLAQNGDNLIDVVAAHTGSFYGRSMIQGQVYTIAGNGTQGAAGNGGPALSAELDHPDFAAVDKAGNVVIADSGSGEIRVVAEATGQFYGQQMTAGDIYQVYARADRFQAVAVDKSGNLLVDDYQGNGVFVVAEATGSFYGQQMTAGNVYPITSNIATSGLALDGAGNVVFGSNLLVDVVAAKTGRFYGQNMTVGHLYTVAGGGSSSANGVPALQAAINPITVAVDQSGNVVIDDLSHYLVRVVAVTNGTFYGEPMTSGDIYTVAGNKSTTFSGDGGPATSAELSAPAGIAVDKAGNYLIADRKNYVLRVLAEATGSFYGQQMAKGDIYTIAGHGSQAPNGVPALKARLTAPNSVAVDSSGNVLIANSDNRAYGAVLVLAEQSGTFYGLNMIAGDIYTLPGVLAASVHLDHNQNLVLTTPDDGSGSGYGAVDVFAVKSGLFYGQNMTANHLYKVAGGGPPASISGVPALQAAVLGTDTVVDGAGNLVIADQGFNIIRVVAVASGTYYGIVMKAGYIYTVAGTGALGPGPNGIPALQARLNAPQAIAVDSSGNLVIADTRDAQIRVVAAKTGLFYGQSMVAGDIYLLTTTGTTYSGGGPVEVRIVPGGGVLVSVQNVVQLISG